MNQLQMLADEVAVNERTLRRAANEGTIRVERPSARRLRISLAEKNYLRRRWQLLAALRAALRTEPNVSFALLFGSAARGDDGTRSDVDLIVQFRDSSLTRVLELEERLERAIERKVDVVSLEAAERNSGLLASAVGEGRVLVDRAGLWPALSAETAALERRARREDRRQTREAFAGIDRLLNR